MGRQRIRVVTFAWGESYVDRLLNFTLSSVMAPGNLPALAEEFDCTVAIVTESRLFRRIKRHPLSAEIERIAELRLIALDDLLGPAWQYGITLAYALFRGMADLGPAMTETYFLFLNADFVLADGSYRNLIPHLRAGEPALLSPSYCAVEEKVRPYLQKLGERSDGIIALPPRQMAELILTHRHNTVRAKTVNQRLYHFEYMDQFYWEVDAHTLLCHQMPVSLVAMRPEVELKQIESFWDWGVVYDFCPSRRLVALGDSDEFLMLEMRAEATHLDLVRLGWSSPEEIASRMLRYITYYQTDNIAFPLILHSRALPDDVDTPKAALRAFASEVLGHLPVAPIDHRNHPAWLYHKHFLENHRRLASENAKIGLLQRQIERLETERASPAWTVDDVQAITEAVCRVNQIVETFGAQLETAIQLFDFVGSDIGAVGRFPELLALTAPVTGGAKLAERVQLFVANTQRSAKNMVAHYQAETALVGGLAAELASLDRLAAECVQATSSNGALAIAKIQASISEITRWLERIASQQELEEKLGGVIESQLESLEHSTALLDSYPLKNNDASKAVSELRSACFVAKHAMASVPAQRAINTRLLGTLEAEVTSLKQFISAVLGNRSAHNVIETTLKELKLEIDQIREKQAQRTAEFETKLQELRAPLDAATQTISRRRKLRYWLTGSAPDLRPWHPYYLVYRGVLRAARAVEAAGASRCLVICDNHGPLDRVLKRRSERPVMLSVSALLGSSRKSDLRDISLCVVELNRANLGLIARVYSALVPLMRHDAKIIMYWNNLGQEPFAAWVGNLVEPALLCGARIQFRYLSSKFADASMRLAKWSPGPIKSPHLQRLLRYLGLSLSSIVAVLGSVAGVRRSSALPRQGARCLGIMLEINQAGEILMDTAESRESAIDVDLSSIPGAIGAKHTGHRDGYASA